MKYMPTLAAVAALATGVAVAQTGDRTGGLSAADVVQRVEQAGYTDVRDVEFDDGLWDVEATSADGRRVELHIDPASGEILDPATAPRLTAADVANRLQAQGYSNVRDIEFDDGRYEVEATDPSGRDVDLKVHPGDGRILSQDDD